MPLSLRGITDALRQEGHENLAAVLFYPYYLLFGLMRGNRPIVIHRGRFLTGLVFSVVTPLVLLFCALAFSLGEKERRV